MFSLCFLSTESRVDESPLFLCRNLPGTYLGYDADVYCHTLAIANSTKWQARTPASGRWAPIQAGLGCTFTGMVGAGALHGLAGAGQDVAGQVPAEILLSPLRSSAPPTSTAPPSLHTHLLPFSSLSLSPLHPAPARHHGGAPRVLCARPLWKQTMGPLMR